MSAFIIFIRISNVGLQATPLNSPARPRQRPGNIDNIVAAGRRIFPVPNNTKPILKSTPLTCFSSKPRFGRSCVHSGTKPMPSRAETARWRESSRRDARRPERPAAFSREVAQGAISGSSAAKRVEFPQEAGTMSLLEI